MIVVACINVGVAEGLWDSRSFFFFGKLLTCIYSLLETVKWGIHRPTLGALTTQPHSMWSALSLRQRGY